MTAGSKAKALEAEASSRKLSHLVAALLIEAAEKILVTPPCTLPCADFICCNLMDDVASALKPAPRAQIHEALIDPAGLISKLTGTRMRGAAVGESSEHCVCCLLFQKIVFVWMYST